MIFAKFITTMDITLGPVNSAVAALWVRCTTVDSSLILGASNYIIKSSSVPCCIRLQPPQLQGQIFCIIAICRYVT